MVRTLGCLAALLLAVSAVMFPRSTSARGGETPIHGSFAGAASADLAHGLVTFDGSGVVSHLGASVNHGQALITGASDACPNGIANINVETLIAANGDTLVLTSLDVACPLDPTGARFHGVGAWTVTGGTGRFSNATGHGTLDGNMDLSQSNFFYQFTGLIALANGN